MLLKLILFIQAICSILAVRNLRLKEVEALYKRIDSRLDINYLFYDKVRSQKNHPLICDAAFGPQCLLINDESLLNTISHNDTPDILEKKASIIRDWDSYRIQEANKPEGSFYVITNSQRDNVINPNKPVPTKHPNALVTLEEVTLEKEEGLIKGSLLYEYGRGMVYEGSLGPNFKEGANTLKIDFENMFVPDNDKIYNRQNIFNNQKYLEKNKETPVEDLEPAAVYAFTNKDESGIIRFSKPVIVKHIYLRKHNILTYFNEREEQGKSKDIIEHHVSGQYQNVEAVAYNKESYISYNKWIKVTPNREGVMIDSLVIGPNMDVDNILFAPYREKDPKQLTAHDFQEMLAYLLEKVGQYSYLTDEKIKSKILRDDLNSYLKKKGVDEDIIKRIIDNFRLKKNGPQQYEVHIDGAWTFLEGLNNDSPFPDIVIDATFADSKDMKEAIKQRLEKTLEKEGMTLNEKDKEEIDQLLELVESVAKSKGGNTVEKKDDKDQEKKSSESK